MQKFDLVVIGGGSAGLVAAVGAAKLGARVCLIEKDRLGGDCLWYGCVPSKALIRSAKVAWDIQNAGKFGLDAKLGLDGKKGDVDLSDGDLSNGDLPGVNLSKVLSHVEDVQRIVGEHDHPKRFESLGIKVVFGIPSFLSRRQVQVNNEWITAKKFLIATGSKARIPDIPGLADAGFVDNVSVFGLRKLPGRLVVIGSGPIGVEMAQAFHRLGSEVTVISRSQYMLSKEDEEIARLAQFLLEKEGITFVTKAKVLGVSKRPNNKVVSVLSKGKTIEVSCDEILVAVGRQPNVEGLNLEAARVKYTSEKIVVDEYLRTSAKNIFAAGDVTGSFNFTHVAEYEAKLVLRNALFPFKSKVRYHAVPWTVFTDPELSRVGDTEADCRGKNIPFTVFRLPFKDVDRAQTEGSPEGMIKLIVDKKAKILGAHILGQSAGELIHEFALAMNAGIPITKISQTIHVYPTLSQAVRKVCDQYYAQKLFKPSNQRLTRWMIRLFS